MSQIRRVIAVTISVWFLNIGPGLAAAAAQTVGWVQAYGSTGYDIGTAIAVDNSANSYVTGYFEGTVTFGAGWTLTASPAGGVFVAKHDSTGTLQWAVQANPDLTANQDASAAATGIAVDAAGNAYVYGRFLGAVTFGPGWTLNSNDTDTVFLAKYDTNGQVKWAVQAAGGAVYPGGIAGDSLGNTYVTGQFNDVVTFGQNTTSAKTVTSQGLYDAFLAKYHADGSVEWVSTIAMTGTSQVPSANDGMGVGVTLDGAGGSYLGGWFHGTATFPTSPTPTSKQTAGGYDLFVAKFDASGAAVWAQSAGDSGDNFGGGVAVDSRRHVFVTASNFRGNTFLLEYDAVGVSLGAQASGLSPLGATAASIAIDSSDNRYVTGDWINASTGAGGLLIAKYGINGNLISSKLVTSGANGGAGITLDLAGNAYVAGSFEGTAAFDAAHSRTSAGGYDVFIARFDTGGARQSQTITFAPLADRIFGEPPFNLTATASSGLMVSFAAAGPCSVSGNLVTLSGAGTCTITASQAGDANFFPANDVAQSFLISPGTPPVITIGNASKAEGNSGTTAFTFTVSLSNPSLLTVTVHFSTNDVTATAGSDYAAASGTVMFNPGTTSQVVDVQVNGDGTFEPDETFAVTLDTPTNATISGSQGVGSATIFNDDLGQLQLTGTAARSLLLQTGTLFPAANIDGRYGANSSAPLSTRGVGVVGAVAQLTSGQPSVGAAATMGATGTGAGRAIGYYQYRNATAKPVSFSAHANLSGTFDAIGGQATGAIYVLDPTAFLDAISASGTSMWQFLLGGDRLGDVAAADPTTFVLTRLFPQAVLGPPAFVKLQAPASGSTPLSTQLVTLAPGQWVTLMFDISVYQSPDGATNFGSTLKAAPVFFTDENGDPAPLTPIGPLTPPPADAAVLTVSPATATTAVGNQMTLTATATTASGEPVVGATVFMQVVSGPNAGPLGLTLTDAAGQASFTYSGSAAGIDQIQANIGTLQSNLAEVTWTEAKQPFTFSGFFRPIDMSTSGLVVWNTVKAGQTVPVKWLLALNGTPVSDPASFAGLWSYPVSCDAGAGSVDDAIDELPTGSSGLQYNGDGNWQYNWKTLTSYKSTCRAVVVKFSDGTTSSAANFKFK